MRPVNIFCKVHELHFFPFFFCQPKNYTAHHAKIHSEHHKEYVTHAYHANKLLLLLKTVLIKLV